MKAYAIKNKEGKYFCGYDAFAGINVFSERIIDGLNAQTPTLEHCMEEIEYYHLNDCEVVEITIAEGDLEQEIEDYKKALNGEMFINFKLPMEHAQFKRQLAEKDKEIEYLEALVKAYEDLYNETHSRFIKALNALMESLDDTK